MIARTGSTWSPLSELRVPHVRFLPVQASAEARSEGNPATFTGMTAKIRRNLQTYWHVADGHSLRRWISILILELNGAAEYCRHGRESWSCNMNTHFGSLPRLISIPLLVTFAALAAPLAQGDAVYTYTGPLFEDFGPGIFGSVAACPPVCSVSGFMVLASPVDFTDFRLVQLLAFSFTDGNTVMTSSDNPPVFAVVALAGDGFGGISQWAVDIGEGTGPVQLESINLIGETPGDSSGSPTQGFDSVSGKAGVWTLSAVTTPEPPTLLLQVVGLLGLLMYWSRLPRPKS